MTSMDDPKRRGLSDYKSWNVDWCKKDIGAVIHLLSERLNAYPLVNHHPMLHLAPGGYDYKLGTVAITYPMTLGLSSWFTRTFDVASFSFSVILVGALLELGKLPKKLPVWDRFHFVFPTLAKGLPSGLGESA
ncbi:hypothetical protein Dimus_035994 [Dionaea muscipula]